MGGIFDGKVAKVMFIVMFCLSHAFSTSAAEGESFGSRLQSLGSRISAAMPSRDDIARTAYRVKAAVLSRIPKTDHYHINKAIQAAQPGEKASTDTLQKFNNLSSEHEQDYFRDKAPADFFSQPDQATTLGKMMENGETESYDDDELLGDQAATTSAAIAPDDVDLVAPQPADPILLPAAAAAHADAATPQPDELDLTTGATAGPAAASDQDPTKEPAEVQADDLDLPVIHAQPAAAAAAAPMPDATPAGPDLATITALGRSFNSDDQENFLQLWKNLAQQESDPEFLSLARYFLAMNTKPELLLSLSPEKLTELLQQIPDSKKHIEERLKTFINNNPSVAETLPAATLFTKSQPARRPEPLTTAQVPSMSPDALRISKGVNASDIRLLAPNITNLEQFWALWDNVRLQGKSPDSHEMARFDLASNTREEILLSLSPEKLTELLKSFSKENKYFLDRILETYVNQHLPDSLSLPGAKLFAKMAPAAAASPAAAALAPKASPLDADDAEHVSFDDLPNPLEDTTPAHTDDSDPFDVSGLAAAASVTPALDDLEDPLRAFGATPEPAAAREGSPVAFAKDPLDLDDESARKAAPAKRPKAKLAAQRTALAAQATEKISMPKKGKDNLEVTVSINEGNPSTPTKILSVDINKAINTLFNGPSQLNDRDLAILNAFFAKYPDDAFGGNTRLSKLMPGLRKQFTATQKERALAKKQEQGFKLR